MGERIHMVDDPTRNLANICERTLDEPSRRAQKQGTRRSTNETSRASNKQQSTPVHEHRPLHNNRHHSGSRGHTIRRHGGPTPHPRGPQLCPTRCVPVARSTLHDTPRAMAVAPQITDLTPRPANPIQAQETSIRHNPLRSFHTNRGDQSMSKIA